MDPKVVMFTEKERQLRAVTKTYKENKAILDFLKERRNPNPLPYQKILDKYKKINPKVKMSVTTQGKWAKEYSIILSNTKVFNEFLKIIGVDHISIAKAVKYKKDKEYFKNKKQVQVVKNNKLEEEMGKAKVIIQQMSNPDLSEEDKFDLAGKSQRQVDIINKEVAEGGLPKAGGVAELFDINGQLLAKGKEIILEKLHTIDVTNMGQLKNLSDVLDSAFKQNRLIEGKSTDNLAVGVSDIYDKIIENANAKNNIQD